MNLRPLSCWVLVARRKAPEKIGSLYIPNAGKTPQDRGEVLRVGDEVTKVKPGESVLFRHMRGLDVEIDKQEAGGLLIEERDIVGVIE